MVAARAVEFERQRALRWFPGVLGAPLGSVLAVATLCTCYYLTLNSDPPHMPGGVRLFPLSFAAFTPPERWVYAIGLGILGIGILIGNLALTRALFWFGCGRQRRPLLVELGVLRTPSAAAAVDDEGSSSVAWPVAFSRATMTNVRRLFVAGFASGLGLIGQAVIPLQSDAGAIAVSGGGVEGSGAPLQMHLQSFFHQGSAGILFLAASYHCFYTVRLYWELRSNLKWHRCFGASKLSPSMKIAALVIMLLSIVFSLACHPAFGTGDLAVASISQFVFVAGMIAYLFSFAADFQAFKRADVLAAPLSVED